MTAWSDLACDALEHVTNFLAIADLHRFSAVCHNWRFVFKQKRHFSAPELPWIVLGEDDKTKKRNFFNFSEGRLYSIDIPELYGHYIVCSSYGWLFTVDRKINGYMVNPFTRESLELPPFPSFYADDAAMTLHAEEAVFEGYSSAIPFRELQGTILKKALLSHDPKKNPDFTVFILFGEFPYRSAIWRAGNTDWTILDSPYLFLYSDAIWFEGNLYIYSDDNMVVVDVVGSNPKVTKLFTVKVAHWGYLFYLVGLKGEMLLMQRTALECKLTVSRVNLKEGALDCPYNIDDIALFFGRKSSLVVDPSEFPGCIPNGIYFANDYPPLTEFELFDNEDVDSPDSPVDSWPVSANIWFAPNLS